MDRAYSELDIGLPISKLHDPVVKALDKGETETLTLEAINHRGKKIEVSVEVMPLIGTDRKVKGAILLMEEHGAKEGGSSEVRPGRGLQDVAVD